MLSVHHLDQRLGTRRVLVGIDLTLEPGTCTVLFGPNGAGKSTLLRVCALLLAPTRGELRWQGQRITSDALHFRRRIGLLADVSFLYPDLTALENLRFWSGLYGAGGSRAEDLLRQVGLWRYRRERVRVFSHGMRRRLALARAMVQEPDVLLLDEPYSGLDDQAAMVVDEMLAAQRNGGRSALVVTHDLERGARMADKTGVLVAGRIVYRGDRVPAAELWPETYRSILAAAR